MATALVVWAYVTAYITFGIGLLSFVARFVSRRLALGLWGWDDTASCFVMIASIIHQVIIQLFLNLGCGKRDNMNCSTHSQDFLRIAFVEEIVIYGSHTIIELTFLLFYLRLSVGQTFRSFVYVGFGFSFCVFITSLLLAFLQCMPFDKILNPAMHPEIKCMDIRVVLLIPPILNIFMDFYIIFLPIPTVWSLRMNIRRKITVIAVLSFGILSVTVAILRLPVLLSVASKKTNISIDVGKTIIVASFEVQSAIIAVNLPAMKSLWTNLRGRFSSNVSNNPDKSFRLSSMGRKRRGETNRTSFMGSITRLERGLGASESKEELFQETDTEAGLDTIEACSSDGGMPGKGTIRVTTSVDIQLSPRGSLQQEEDHPGIR